MTSDDQVRELLQITRTLVETNQRQTQVIGESLIILTQQVEELVSQAKIYNSWSNSVSGSIRQLAGGMRTQVALVGQLMNAVRRKEEQLECLNAQIYRDGSTAESDAVEPLPFTRRRYG